MGKRTDPAKKRAEKQRVFLERTAQIIEQSPASCQELLRQPRVQSIRRNPLIKTAAIPDDVAATPCSWSKDCYYTDHTAISTQFASHIDRGELYIQNAASWLPIYALDPRPQEHILDMCAAPGGKTSHIAAQTDNQAIITANDNSRTRLHKMQHNLSRLGVKNCTFLLHNAQHLSRHLDSGFDKILLDAPCSGEGMIQFDTLKEFDSWSVSHIKRLEKLQKQLISEAWRLLKPGGTLVYSTCTMAPEENESVVHFLLRKHSDAHIVPIDLNLENRHPSIMRWNNNDYHPDIQHTMRLLPSRHIHAFFVAKIMKEK